MPEAVICLGRPAGKAHPDWYPQVRARHEAIAAAFREQAAEM